MVGGQLMQIPSNEDFERASKKHSLEYRGLESVCNRVKQHFEARCSFHDIFMFVEKDEDSPQDWPDFRAVVVFKHDSDVEHYLNDGLAQQVIDKTYEEIEKAGRGRRPDITIEFEFDSDENIKATYGSYSNRLRS